MAKDRWDKADIIAKMVVGVLVPVVIAFFGYKINRSIQEKALQQKDIELSQKYIEIAVGILHSDPSNKEEEPLRDWAIDVLKKYSPIEISPAVIKALKNHPLSVVMKGNLGMVASPASEVSFGVKVHKNETVPVFDNKLSIFVQTIKLAETSGRPVVDGAFIVGQKIKKFSSVEAGTCLSYAGYAISVKSISNDSVNFLVFEKPCK